MILNDILEIAFHLHWKTNKIMLLHKLWFNIEGDRQNRSRIRAFSGFYFSLTDAYFNTKFDESANFFSLIEFISISTILRIEIDGTKSHLAERIISLLTDLESFRQYIQSSVNSDSESEDIPNNPVVKAINLT